MHRPQNENSSPNTTDSNRVIDNNGNLKEMVRSLLTREFLSNILVQTPQPLQSQSHLNDGHETIHRGIKRRFGSIAFPKDDEQQVNGFLNQKLGKEHLSRRAGPRGTRLTYIESCKAIELANQAFGFNGWSCHILECKEEYVSSY